jgi:xylulokinase
LKVLTLVQKDLVVGVDCSTTACKAIAWDRRGRQVAESRASFELVSPRPNWYEQQAGDWWTALCQVLRGVTSQVGAGRIAALCITHQRETFVPVDEAGQPIRNAILWLDERSRQQVAELDRRVGNDTIHDLTGRASHQPALPKLLWLQAREPEVVHPRLPSGCPCLLIHRLTGRWVTGTPCADPMGMLGRGGALGDRAAANRQLNPDQFNDIVPSGTIRADSPNRHKRPLNADSWWSPEPVMATAGLSANITGRVAPINLGTAVVSGALDRYVASQAFHLVFAD